MKKILFSFLINYTVMLKRSTRQRISIEIKIIYRTAKVSCMITFIHKRIYFIVLVVIDATLFALSSQNDLSRRRNLKERTSVGDWEGICLERFVMYQADLILVRHAKGGVRRDAHSANTYTSHYPSYHSFYSHGISWHFRIPPERSLSN